MNHYENIDAAIAVYLRRSGKTQGQLAGEIGLSENALYMKRTGRTEFKLSEVVRLSKILGTPIDALVYG